MNSLHDAASTRCTESHQTVMVVQNRAQTPVLPSTAADKERRGRVTLTVQARDCASQHGCPQQNILYEAG